MTIDTFLREHGINPARYEHAPVFTVEESERLVPRLPGAKTKNLFLRDKKGLRHFLVTARHDVAIDLATLGAVIGAGRLGFASSARLVQHLRVAPGAVSLLDLRNDTARQVEFVIDEVLWQAPALQAHPLVNTATMVLTHADLEWFLAATGHVPRVLGLGI
ncbi:MAG: prolyl-tRNA synthetase associated domain-containing protein [Casimicrobiaceae bacterium]